MYVHTYVCRCTLSLCLCRDRHTHISGVQVCTHSVFIHIHMIYLYIHTIDTYIHTCVLVCVRACVCMCVCVCACVYVCVSTTQVRAGTHSWGADIFAIWPHASLLLEPQPVPQRGGLRSRGSRGGGDVVLGGRDIGADGEEEVGVDEEDWGDSGGGGGEGRGGGGGRGGWDGRVCLIGR